MDPARPAIAKAPQSEMSIPDGRRFGPCAAFATLHAYLGDVDKKEVALDDHWQLVAGTAWLLARPEADQQFDYLFVDEAGHVSLANPAAMGACARNIVLLGDQMQLGQPIQGVHPGRSGESSLEYLLDGHATVPPERGVFLPITWRMCPDVCRFISEAVYDGRLFPEEMNAHQRLVLGAKPHAALRPTGVVFWPMDHTGCGQKSPEEALLQPAGEPVEARAARHRARRDGGQVPGPGGGGVADLDDDLERGRPAPPPRVPVQQEPVERSDFAVRCLSVVVANPRLLDTRCRTAGEIALVNTLCWAARS